MTLGSTARDQRKGLRLEHGTLDLAARIDRRFGARLAVGWHDRDKAHTEAALIQGSLPIGDDELQIRVGRDRVRHGVVIDGAGHFDVFSLPPLATRAVLNDQWIDDGIVLAWRRGDADGLRAAELGAWRGRAFPGGAQGAVAPTLHLQGGWGRFDAHVSYAHLQPRGRGAAALALGNTGHAHGSLDCRLSLQQRVCFDGAVDVASASLQWEPDASPWSFAAAGLVKRERGTLYSTSAEAAMRSTLTGGWAEARWRPVDDWTFAGRLERLVPDNGLQGFGTAALAQSAGWTGGGPVERVTAAVLRRWGEHWTLSVEAGHERHAAGTVSHVALRAMWRNPRLLGGRW